ncbi:hypothetical protein CAC42_6098 [Sphaceloma murrayae]|uniref:Uncharacterized protein n=1 Tax=Sphaceloma murrayae TaxID=2082308 RepID=A0A2K1QVU0_9PEZI|nr:hypothetical protein CAC42_6098 [Sphaceloma murrayae]
MPSVISPVSPSNSFRQVKAVLSPLGSPSPSYSNMSDAQSYMSDPASPGSSPCRSNPSNRFSVASNFSNLSFQLRNMRNMIRRKPSTVELEIEEERRLCTDGRLDLIEPRPSAVSHVNGIEEVLFGRL